MNKVMLIGNVGQEPEVRYVDAGVAVAKLTLATTERGYTLQNGTQVPDRTDWHRIILWKRLAEVVEKYVHKGDKLYIEGRLRYSTYDDKNGIRHNLTEIWAENMEMLTPKSQSGKTSTEHQKLVDETVKPSPLPSNQDNSSPSDASATVDDGVFIF
ncbi:MAG: single-stranded DNA-binding protein [Prevotellaceae bacterium]|nr:single-stranded DNA-binding protein [Prevotella sp.]MDD6818642.1 single-stranded DNA-binding protein [Prevotellaceae bacterium]MCI7044735.1 single-stranded DNA-binding protein [Prevotella sp.]MDD6977426.1 single-stranded DNA-binding protein [Prevotellaceae bacterium]MDD7098175.1 single-stranded DNA-binding protein [Prevotellaceae bacterium]